MDDEFQAMRMVAYIDAVLLGRWNVARAILATIREAGMSDVDVACALATRVALMRQTAMLPHKAEPDFDAGRTADPKIELSAAHRQAAGVLGALVNAVTAGDVEAVRRIKALDDPVAWAAVPEVAVSWLRTWVLHSVQHDLDVPDAA